MRKNLKTKGLTLVELVIVLAVLFILAAMLLPAGGRSRADRKRAAARIQCVNNLKSIGFAFRIWANDNQELLPTQTSITNGGAMEAVLNGDVAVAFQVMSNELITPKILFCPTDKKRIQATTFNPTDPSIGKRGSALFVSNTNLSYFVGLDANNTFPSMFLSGDDNFLVGGNKAGFGGSPVPSGILSLISNTPIAWSEARHEKQGNVGLADGSVQGFSSTALRRALENTGVETNRLVMP